MFDVVVLTMPVPQVLGLTGTIKELLGGLGVCFLLKDYGKRRAIVGMLIFSLWSFSFSVFSISFYVSP